MNAKPIVTVLAGLGLLLLGLSTTPALQDSRGDRLDLLEQDLAQTKAQVQELAGEVQKANHLLEETVAYLNQQAAGGRDLKAQLSAVEEAGFTAGQNWRSRELLLEGIRAWIDNQQKDLPGEKKKAGAKAAAAPGGN